MGQASPLTASKTDIRVELEALTPIVGLNIIPKIHMSQVSHGVLFRWYRLPEKFSLLPSSAHASITSNVDKHDVDSVAVPNSTVPFVNAADGQHQIDWKTTAAENAASISEQLGDENFLNTLLILSQSAAYCPTLSDVGHRLLFITTLMTDQVGEPHAVLMDICLPMPIFSPMNMWMENSDYVISRNQRIQRKQDQRLGVFSGGLQLAGGLTLSARALAGSPSIDEIDTSCTLLSYNLAAIGWLQDLLQRPEDLDLRSMFPRCPSFALMPAFRKRMQLTELLSYGTDLISLQAVSNREYDSLYLELSKSGYSATFSAIETGTFASGTSDTYTEKYGICIMYKRGKFSKIGHWELKYSECLSEFQAMRDKSAEHAIVVQNIDRLCAQCGLKVQDLDFQGRVALVSALEFKDYYMASIGRVDATQAQNEGKVMVINTMLSQQVLPSSSIATVAPSIKTQLTQLVQVYLLLSKFSMLQEEQGLIGAPVIFSGDLGHDSSGWVYEFLTKGSLTVLPIEASLRSQSLSDNGSGSATAEVTLATDPKKYLLSERSSAELFDAVVPFDADTDMSKPQVKLEHPYSFLSTYKDLLQREPSYVLSDAAQTQQSATEFIFYSRTKCRLMHVADLIPNTLPIPNATHTSNHIPLMVQIDVLLAGDLREVEQAEAQTAAVLQQHRTSIIDDDDVFAAVTEQEILDEEDERSISSVSDGPLSPISMRRRSADAASQTSPVAVPPGT